MEKHILKCEFMGKNEKSGNDNNCNFFEIETVQGINHEFCSNSQMYKINNVQNGKKLSCMGNSCGLAIFGKKNK